MWISNSIIYTIAVSDTIAEESPGSLEEQNEEEFDETTQLNPLFRVGALWVFVGEKPV